MIGIPHCNSLTKTPADRYLPFASRPILSAISWAVPIWESHSTENLRPPWRKASMKNTCDLKRLQSGWIVSTIAWLFQLTMVPQYYRGIFVRSTLLKTCLIFYLAKCTVDISGSITRLLTGTTNDFFLHKSSKPFRRWPVIFQDSFLPHN